MADPSEGQQPSSPAEKDKAPSRPILSEGEMANLTAAEWSSRWRQQDTHILALERRASSQEGELSELRQTTEKLKQQLLDSQQREKFLVRRIAVKEQESHDLVNDHEFFRYKQNYYKLEVISKNIVKPLYINI